MHKKQHFVPATYLKAWCDKDSPEDYKPYVWIYPKEGGKAKHKPPEKIFWENDFYTIKKLNGERDLVLDHGLAQLESRFANLRDRKLGHRKPLTSQDMGVLCAFTAAMYSRTKVRRGFLKEQWQAVVDLGNKMEEWAKNASKEDLEWARTALHTPHKNNQSLSMDEVRQIADSPIQSSLRAEIATVAPALFKMQFVILDTSDISTFITSDNPCIWFDPDLYKKPVPPGAGGLISPTIEISLPLSPTQYILFGKKLMMS